MALQSTLPHKSTHALGGSDAIAPSDIGAEPSFDYRGETIIGFPLTLEESRARIWTFNCIVGATVTLPTTAEVGDRIVLWSLNQMTAAIIVSSTGVADTLSSSNQQLSYRYYVGPNGPRWYKNLVDKHTHAIADTTGLQTALNGKQPSGSYVVRNTADTTPVNAIRAVTQQEYTDLAAAGAIDENTIYFIKQ